MVNPLVESDGSGGARFQVVSPLVGTVVAIHTSVGAYVKAGMPVVTIESMKMEHPVTAQVSGRVTALHVTVGEASLVGHVLVELVEESHAVVTDDSGSSVRTTIPSSAQSEVPAELRTDLSELRAAQALLADDARPQAVAKRHGRGQRTARENIAALCDAGSFHEYGGFAFAAQEGRRSLQDLQTNTPADGLITGIGSVNGELFPDDGTSCAVVAYDYTVLAGTQGYRNHQKKDRIFEIIERLALPTILFAEGGGGRPGDTDIPVISGLDTRAFELFARLSGQVPTVGIVTGRCFAGNAALLGCCDTIIATLDSNIGMGGPAMIEGGGLGACAPEDIGPIDVQSTNGVVDIVVSDEAEAVVVAKKYLSYFQGDTADWTLNDQTQLRAAVPENRKAIYDIRAVINVLADAESVLELRSGFGAGMITALARLEGRPVGILANNPSHLGGAIDSNGADKAARFLQLCDVHGLPVVFLCDTPGFMVGPDAERSAQVRHFSRMFVTAAAMTVPFGTVVMRKGYGLGAQSMAGGSFRAGLFTLSWPTGEFGGMGLEGAVRLGFRRELEAIVDEAERQTAFEAMVAAAYERGKALNMAAHLEIDDVIDPAETRTRVIDLLHAAPARTGQPRRFIDTW